MAKADATNPLGIPEARFSTETEWFSYTAIGILGLDEIAIKKGQRSGC